MPIPESLQQKIDWFSAKGRALPTPDDLFTEHSWIAVMLGQGIEPDGYDPLVDSLPIENLRRFARRPNASGQTTSSSSSSHRTQAYEADTT
jgi:tryptophan halogenase